MGRKRAALGRRIVLGLPFAWLAILFFLPFLIVLKIAFSTSAISIPPYAPVFDFGDGLAGLWAKLRELGPQNFLYLGESDLYWRSYLSSLLIALVSTALLLLAGYPIAYGMARAPAAWRPLLVTLVILPFWVPFLIRVYSWIGILRSEGLLNELLLALGLIDEPLTILNTDAAVYVGIVYSYLPFMILPLYASLERIDHALLEAAADLGARPLGAFWRVTFPLSLPGVVAGCFLVFIPITGEFVIPDLLGGSDTLMIGKTLWSEFFENRDWPVAAAVAIVLLILLVGPILLFQRLEQRRAEAAR